MMLRTLTNKIQELNRYNIAMILLIVFVISMMVYGHIKEDIFVKHCIESGHVIWPTATMGDYCL